MFKFMQQCYYDILYLLSIFLTYYIRKAHSNLIYAWEKFLQYIGFVLEKSSDIFGALKLILTVYFFLIKESLKEKVKA